jgi:hypothetical protein
VVVVGVVVVVLAAGADLRLDVVLFAAPIKN